MSIKQHQASARANQCRSSSIKHLPGTCNAGRWSVIVGPLSLVVVLALGLWLGFWYTSTAPSAAQGPAVQQPVTTPTLAPPAPLVQLGEPQTVAAFPDDLPAGYTIAMPHEQGSTRLLITNRATGETIRLGTDEGSTYLFDISTRYVLWGFLCHQGCHTAAAQSTGYYLYDLTTGTNQTFAPALTHGIAVGALGDTWVVFASVRTRDSARLEAAHMATGEVITLVENLTFPGSYAFRITSERLFAVAGDTVVWTDQGLHLYNLHTRTAHLLPVPAELTPAKGYEAYDPSPRHLSLSATALVWFSQWRWWVYDRLTEQVIPIPATVPGMPEPAPGVHRYLVNARVQDDTVFWQVGIQTEDTPEQLTTYAAPLLRTRPAGEP